MLRKLIARRPRKRGERLNSRKQSSLKEFNVDQRKLNRQAMRLRNQAWYLENRPRLLETHKGKFLVIDNEQIISAENTYAALLEFLDTPDNRPRLASFFLTFCGFEDYRPSVIQERQQPLLEDYMLKGPPKHEHEYRKLEAFNPVGWFPPSETGFPLPYITLPVKTDCDENFVYPVSFLVDTGTSTTVLSAKTISALEIAKDDPKHLGPVIFIDEVPIPVTNSAGSEINVLGNDYIYKRLLQMAKFRDSLLISRPDL